MYKLKIDECITEYKTPFELLEAVTVLANSYALEITESLEKSIKDANRKRIFAIGKELGLSTEQIKQRIYEILKIDSLTKMTPEQSDEIIKLMSDRLHSSSPADEN